MRKQSTSNNLIRRLPRYLRRLEELSANGIERISSNELGRQLGVTPSQVRQDLSTFGEFGVQGYGYNVNQLHDQILNILGGYNGYNAIVVGVGKIGSALISNFSFRDCGINLQCAFDVRDGLVGSQICGVPVYHMDELPGYLQSHAVDIAVLAVPKQAAMEVVHTLQTNKVDAVWNFTNMDIQRPESEMIVENIHFSDSLFALSYYLSQKRENNNE